MAHFSNGTDGVSYLENVCFKCKNWKDEKDGRGYGCPIMDLHVLYGYELFNSKSLAKWMLDYLIPDDIGVGQKTCTMFLERDDITDPAQLSWLKENKQPHKERVEFKGDIPK